MPKSVTLAQAHERLVPLARRSGRYGAAAAIVGIVAVVIITSSGLVAMIPDVNVMRDVVLRGVFPGTVLLGFDVLLIIETVKASKKKDKVYKVVAENVKQRLEEKNFLGLSKDERVEAVRELFPMKPHNLKADRLYRAYVLSGVMKSYSKKEKELTYHQKAMKKAIEECMKADFKSPHAKKEKE